MDMHVYIETGMRTQATPSKRAREEVPRLRNRRDAGEKAMELVQSHSQRILSYSSSPASILLVCFNQSDYVDMHVHMVNTLCIDVGSLYYC